MHSPLHWMNKLFFFSFIDEFWWYLQCLENLMAHCVTIAMTFRWALLWICSELTTALGGSELTKPWETCEQSGTLVEMLD